MSKSDSYARQFGIERRDVSSNFVIAYTGRVVENRLINFVRMASLFDAETRHERITIRPVGGVREFVSPIPKQISEKVRSPLCSFHSPRQRHVLGDEP